MKYWKILLAVTALLGLIGGSWLIGCGDDNEEKCPGICDKIAECMPEGYSESVCRDNCENYDSDIVDCADDCNKDLACPNYGVCLNQCYWTYIWDWD